jgi:P pilus assembly chaperone PapD
MMCERWRHVVLVAFVVFAVPQTHAGISVYPTEVFVVSPVRSAPLTISNPTDSVVEVWVSFGYGYPVAFDSGKVSMSRSDTAGIGELSAAKWLRAYPQRFTLGPQGSQAVRVFGTPPTGLTGGEYWARIYFSSKPKNQRVLVTKNNQTKVMMELVSQTSVPYHFRTGVVTSSVLVKQARASMDDGFLRLHIDMRRTGNAAFWGRINYKLLSSGGKVVRTKDYRVVAYKEMAYSVLDTLPTTYEGPYTVELTIDNVHPSVAAQYRISSEPFRQRIPVTVP